MVSPSVTKNKSAAKGKIFEKKNSFGKVFKKTGKQEEKYPLCPWKMTRYRNALHYHHCDECRDKNFHNEKKAVETPDGGVRVSLYFCKKSAEANIYMGNIYKKTWKEDPEPAQDVEENEEESVDVNEEDEAEE
ncbi:hypothetical protein AAVH_13424 [Aphelenchoides avenae]|nr:hypothetical protein AAVH_13424 [Aphelenchus avenae]